MSVLTPQRGDAAAPPPPPPRTPDEPRRRSRGPRPSLGLIGLVATAILIFLAVGWVRDIIPSFDNPFTTETIDRSRPALLKSIRNLSDYHAASGHFEVIVDVEKDTRFVPDVIRGERVLFVAVGSVDAGFDFSRLDERSVSVSGDRATITLPPARFFGAQVDPERSYVYDRDRGLFDRVSGLFGDNPTGERELYVLSQQKLLAAAQANSGLLRRAEGNTKAMLESLLRALGFEQVSVEFIRL
jgi:hypothetical protein